MTCYQIKTFNLLRYIFQLRCSPYLRSRDPDSGIQESSHTRSKSHSCDPSLCSNATHDQQHKQAMACTKSEKEKECLFYIWHHESDKVICGRIRSKLESELAITKSRLIRELAKQFFPEKSDYPGPLKHCMCCADCSRMYDPRYYDNLVKIPMPGKP